MIFYFSGTGNSKYVAEQIAGKIGDQCIFITEESRKEYKTYTPREKERIGIVTPTYWYGLPTIVERFLKDLKIESDAYLYLIATYGSSGGGIGNDVKKLLMDNKLKLSAQFGVTCVDNYVIAYDIPGEEEQIRMKEQMDETIKVISEKIISETKTDMLKKGKIAAISPILHKLYQNTDHTKKFYVTDACSGCRFCAMNCPCQVIKMDEGRPTWKGPSHENTECSLCLGCLHKCPQKAIQYGKKTIRHGRYQMNGATGK